MANNLEKNYLQKAAAKLKSQAGKIAGALAIAAVLGVATPSFSQTIEKKKGYEKVEKTADAAQENIGKEMAKFIFGGGIERELQIEIEKQNSKHAKNKGDYTLFKDKNVQDNDAEDRISSKKDMEDKLRKRIDSMATNDVSEYYLAFQKFQKSGINLLGHKKGKGGAGWALLPFTANQDMAEDIKEGFKKDGIKLPYSKGQLESTLEGFAEIYKKGLTSRQKTALENRKKLTPEEYESANLLSLEEARLKIVEDLYKKYGQTIVERMFNQFYGLDKKTKK
ncbi:MAG: hypothetical protein NTY80_04645 [candidate division SR1 bacterium]|nr:hypothetical protein [candidate division SR1 bacterium]